MKKADARTGEEWERYVVYQREWRQRNRDRVNAQVRERRQLNLERIRHQNNARNRRWGQTERGRVNAVIRQARRRVRVRGLSDADADWLSVLRADPCSYCGRYGGEADHIVPVMAGGTNEWDNFTSACRTCNARKHDRSLLAFIAQAA